MFDPTVVNSKILELTKEKINLQNQFTLANSVQVIEGIYHLSKHLPNQDFQFHWLLDASVGLVFVAAYHCI